MSTTICMQELYEPNTLILTGATGPHEHLLALARPTFQKYAQRWDMDYEETPLGHDYPPAWHKIPAIRQALDHYDTVVWLDADCIIVDGSENITEVAKGSLSWVHHVLDGMIYPNFGVVVIRKTPQMKHFLDDVWDMREKYRNHPWWEQAAAMELMGWDPCWPGCQWKAHTKYSFYSSHLHPRWNVLVGRTEAKNPAILHASGMSMAERLNVMRSA